MKLSIFPKYGALNSVPVFESFIAGARSLGHRVVEHDLDADIYVIWSVLWHGRMKANQEIWKKAKDKGIPIIILEVGGLRRGVTWRMGLNHINASGTFCKKINYDLNRPQKLGIFLREKAVQGKNILICGQHSKSEQWIHRPRPEIWLKNLVTEIKNHTDRKIIFRPHPRDTDWCKNLPNLGIEVSLPQKILQSYDDFNHEDDFGHAWCVINPCSNTGIQAAIAGLPIFVEKDSLAFDVSNKDYCNLENPQIFDRQDWLIKVCHTEWTLEELTSGIALGNLM